MQTFWEPDPCLAAHSAIATRHWAGVSKDRQRGAREKRTVKSRLSKQRLEATEKEGFRPRGGAGGPELRVAHLHDTVISTLVAGMLPAKESNSLSDAMSSGCSIAHRPPPRPN